MSDHNEKPAICPTCGNSVLKPYSVLLLYPDYIAKDYGQETYYAFVEAEDPGQAVHIAQKEACTANESCDDSEDFYPLLVIEGHHECCVPGFVGLKDHWEDQEG